jgi:thiol-disulfide isomerase/thioredoxin
MAETPSTMLALGTPLPAFSLTDAVSGKTITDRDIAGAKGTLVMFICNHCPFVKHVLPELDRVIADYASRDIGIVAVNSNDVEAYPDDGPPAMKELATSRGWGIPFVLDETQSLAKTLQAACTPDFFAFDAARRLAYRGRLDASRPKSDTPLSGSDLRAALDAIVASRAPAAEQMPSVGCNIKWKAAVTPS